MTVSSLLPAFHLLKVLQVNIMKGKSRPAVTAAAILTQKERMIWPVTEWWCLHHQNTCYCSPSISNWWNACRQKHDLSHRCGCLEKKFKSEWNSTLIINNVQCAVSVGIQLFCPCLACRFYTSRNESYERNENNSIKTETVNAGWRYSGIVQAVHRNSYLTSVWKSHGLHNSKWLREYIKMIQKYTHS